MAGRQGAGHSFPQTRNDRPGQIGSNAIHVNHGQNIDPRARVRRPPNGSVFAWRLGFCGSPPGRSDCPWERGRPARILFLLGVAEHQRDFAGSHHVGGNRNGQAEGEPRRRCRSIQVEELAEAAPGFVRAGRPRSQEAIIPRMRAGRPRSQEFASNTGPAAHRQLTPPPRVKDFTLPPIGICRTIGRSEEARPGSDSRRPRAAPSRERGDTR